jgi:hypothetical protein
VSLKVSTLSELTVFCSLQASAANADVEVMHVSHDDLAGTQAVFTAADQHAFDATFAMRLPAEHARFKQPSVAVEIMGTHQCAARTIRLLRKQTTLTMAAPAGATPVMLLAPISLSDDAEGDVLVVSVSLDAASALRCDPRPLEFAVVVRISDQLTRDTFVKPKVAVFTASPQLGLAVLAALLVIGAAMLVKIVEMLRGLRRTAAASAAVVQA